MNPSTQTDLSALDTAITRTHRLVIAVTLVSLAFYVCWFWLLKGRPLSGDTGAWGEFGDFVGGILNPLVAYSAFYWLTRSVRLQKEELLETRKALEETALSQAKQAAASEASVRVAAYTALINSSMLEVQSLRQQASSLTEQSSRHQAGSARLSDGRWMTSQDLIDHMASLDNRVNYHLGQRTKYENQLKILLGLSIHAA